MLRSHAQSVLANYFGNFCHRTSCLRSKITDNHEGFIDEHARSFFQFRQRNAWIEVAVESAPPTTMCAVSFDVAPRKVPIRFAGEVTFFMTSSSFSIILR